MSEKQPKDKESPEQILRKLGRKAVRMDQIKQPGVDCSLAPGIIEQDNGDIHFWSGHKFIDAPGVRPLIRGLVNPNNN